MQLKKNLKFDIITFFEILEHQDNPKKFLKNIKNLLNLGGYIAGSVPNRKFLFSKYLCSYLDTPPHHLLRFSPLALENTLKYLNFHNILVYPTNFSSNNWDAYIEKILFKNFDKYKIWLKKFLISNSSGNLNFPVEILQQIDRSNKVSILLFLKKFVSLYFIQYMYTYLLNMVKKVKDSFYISKVNFYEFLKILKK